RPFFFDPDLEPLEAHEHAAFLDLGLERVERARRRPGEPRAVEREAALVARARDRVVLRGARRSHVAARVRARRREHAHGVAVERREDRDDRGPESASARARAEGARRAGEELSAIRTILRAGRVHARPRLAHYFLALGSLGAPRRLMRKALTVCENFSGSSMN